MNPMPKWLPYVLVGVALALMVLASLRGPESTRPLEIAYSDFKERVAKGEVSGVILRGEKAEAKLSQAIPAGPAGGEAAVA